ncbi:hypothetical protein M413DRAFT_444402 [Hebeloma cylindrosporum]|uniref:AB hydrolase-1 domain-containing protein n=1 Tax=Hebeloma cylindrosporum TaxID=76867 RepID=A0A0C3CEV9_HEBCY|nr:hypothetical protein M413DRAFT_444402 [Hebeloma cylindrosporum h7]
MSFGRWLLFFTYLGLVQAEANSASSFKPSQYPKKTAHCKATRRAPVEEAVDIQLKYVDINPEASTTLIMVHGWPSLWSTWSNQILEFQEDYHLIAPELRGFGESTHPGDTKSSGTMGDMVGDLVCILEHAKVSSAICMGHDWGSTICYEAARSRPDIFTGVVGAVVPYIPSSGPFVPIKNLLPIFPSLTYQLFFDLQTEKAVAELDKDIRRTTRATLRTAKNHPPTAFLKDENSFLAAWDHVEEIPPVSFFTQEEEDYFVEQYSINGFKHTLQFYTTENRHEGWRHAHFQGNHTISQPVLAIYPKEDPVADWLVAATVLKSADYLPDLTTEVLPGAHWVHLEYPKEFNELVRKWLDRTFNHSINDNSGSHDEL